MASPYRAVSMNEGLVGTAKKNATISFVHKKSGATDFFGSVLQKLGGAESQKPAVLHLFIPLFLLSLPYCVRIYKQVLFYCSLEHPTIRRHFL